MSVLVCSTGSKGALPRGIKRGAPAAGAGVPVPLALYNDKDYVLCLRSGRSSATHPMFMPVGKFICFIFLPI